MNKMTLYIGAGLMILMGYIGKNESYIAVGVGLGWIGVSSK